MINIQALLGTLCNIKLYLLFILIRENLGIVYYEVVIEYSAFRDGVPTRFTTFYLLKLVK